MMEEWGAGPSLNFSQIFFQFLSGSPDRSLDHRRLAAAFARELPVEIPEEFF